MKKVLYSLGLFLLPAVTFAQGTNNDLFGVLGIASKMINIITVILVALAVLMFIWGVIQYVSSGGDEEAQGKARNTMIYGIVGIFVIVAVWGLVNILKNTFIGDNTVNPAPCVPGLIDEYGQQIPC